MFYCQFTGRSATTYEYEDNDYNYGDDIVDSSGYLSPEQRIKNLILSGQNLVASRKEQYDFDADEEVDETFTDPTRSGNYDLSDAFQDSEYLKNHYNSKLSTSTQKQADADNATDTTSNTGADDATASPQASG